MGYPKTSWSRFLPSQRTATHNRLVDAPNANSIFLDKRQKSYNTNQFGRSAVASPWATIEYRRMQKTFLVTGASTG